MKLKLWLLGMASILIFSGCLFEEDEDVDYGETAVFYFDSYYYESYGTNHARDSYYADYCSMKGFCGNIVDERDNKNYGWVLINNTKWLQRDLDYATPNSYCFEGFCDYYGREYSWSEAMGLDTSYNHKHYSLGNEDKQGICLEGWRLPRLEDFALADFTTYYILNFDVNLREEKYFFNPDSLYKYKDISKLKKKIYENAIGDQDRGYFPNDFFSEAQWGLDNIDNPFDMNVNMPQSVTTYMLGEEDSLDATKYKVIKRGNSYYSGPAYITREKSTSILEMSRIRCVQDITYDEAQQIWIDAFNDKWDIELIPDSTLDYKKF